MGHTYMHDSQEDDCWEVEIETIEKCSKAPEKAKVYMAPLVKVKINALMEKFSHIEWFAYLVGKKLNEDDYLVENLLIPQQTVTGGSVTNVICPEFNKFPVIGAIHSHHTMSNHFSGTDNEWVNQNHNVSLVVATDGIAGQVRWQTPCGGIIIIPAKVLPYIDVDFDKEKFYKDELDKIQEPKHISTVNSFNSSNHNFNTNCRMGRVGRSEVPTQTVIDEDDEYDESLLTALQEAYPDIDKSENSSK